MPRHGLGVRATPGRLPAAAFAAAEAALVRPDVAALEGHEDRLPEPLQEGELGEDAAAAAQRDQRLAEVEVEDVIALRRRAQEAESPAEPRGRREALQVDGDVGAVAELGSAEDDDVALQAELALGPGELERMPSNVGWRMQDPSRRHA
jgi:hypothetical protein